MEYVHFMLTYPGNPHIAIEFAHQAWLESRASVFWVSASSIDRFHEGYNAIFDQHINPDSDVKCDEITTHHSSNRLSQENSRQKAISSTASVKFTKGAADALIEVEPITNEESTCLFKKSMTDHILEEIQAVDLIQENSMSVGEYIELYNESEETSMDLLCEPFGTLGREQNLQGLNSAQDKRPLELTKALDTLMAFSLIQATGAKGEVGRKRIHLQEGIAYHLWSQGLNQDAEKLDTELVEEKRQEFGTDHPETLESIAGLASTYYDQARWAEAEKLDTFIVETRKRALGSHDKLTLTSMANLARKIRTQNLLEEAEKLRSEILETAKSQFGENDEQTITAMGNLGPVYLDVRRLDEAAQLMKNVVRSQTKEFGPELQYTLTSSSVLSEICKAQGKLEGARDSPGSNSPRNLA
ncbi:hypothetical protein BJX70DRAFT_402579 [Aspergillus crustosus]